MTERSTRQKALGASVILALSLHALALWGMEALTWGRRASGSQAAVQSVQLRLLHGEATHTGHQQTVIDVSVEPEPANTKEPGSPLDPVRHTSAEPENRSPAYTGESQTEVRADSLSPEESELLIEHPDGPLPGGHAKAQVAMILGRQGHIDAIELEPGALPDAFIEAVRSAFVGRRAASGLGPQPKQGARICVEVDFRESEPPRWRIQEPPSGPKLPC